MSRYTLYISTTLNNQSNSIITVMTGSLYEIREYLIMRELNQKEAREYYDKRLAISDVYDESRFECTYDAYDWCTEDGYLIVLKK